MRVHHTPPAPPSRVAPRRRSRRPREPCHTRVYGATSYSPNPYPLQPRVMTQEMRRNRHPEASPPVRPRTARSRAPSRRANALSSRCARDAIDVVRARSGRRALERARARGIVGEFHRRDAGPGGSTAPLGRWRRPRARARGRKTIGRGGTEGGTIEGGGGTSSARGDDARGSSARDARGEGRRGRESQTDSEIDL